jgi:hypothetical protein
MELEYGAGLMKDLCKLVLAYISICLGYPASCTMDTGGPFPGAKARPGRDADHSPPSSADVDNE